MNSKNHTKKSKSNKGGLIREFAAARLGQVKRPVTDMTLTQSGSLTAGVIGTNGYVFPINWNTFKDIANLPGLYQYFEVLGYKIDFSLNKDITTFYEGAVAYHPVNYVIGDTLSAAAPSSSGQIADLPGVIFLEEGTKNIGKWCAPTCKQVYSTYDAFVNTRLAGQIITYVNNVGVAETFGGFNLSLNIRLYSKNYSSAI
jgi:hypothetical protein